jgi:hypothetical protein
MLNTLSNTTGETQVEEVEVILKKFCQKSIFTVLDKKV